MGPTRTTGENGSPLSDGAWTAAGAAALAPVFAAQPAAVSVDSIAAKTRGDESVRVMGGEDIGSPSGCQPRTGRGSPHDVARIGREAGGRARRRTDWSTASGSVVVRQLATMGNDVPLPRKGMTATPRERGPFLAGQGTSE